MLKAAKNMGGKFVLFHRFTGLPGHRLHIFLNSTYEQKITVLNNPLCNRDIYITKIARNVRAFAMNLSLSLDVLSMNLS